MTSRLPSRPRLPRPRLALLVLLFGYLVFPMGMTGTSIALPEIGRDLDASGAALQWVVTGYVLAASSVMLIAGSFGDLFGRRKVYTVGVTLYAAGSLAAAVSQNILVLDIARTITGVGGAGVMAGGVAILATIFEGPRRTRAFAAVGTTAGIGIAVGPTLSGWLVGAFGWRPAFLLFGVVGLLIMVGTRLIPESRAADRPKVDRPGVVTFIAGQASLMFAITQGAQSGWTSAAVLGPLVAGVALLSVFVAVERRSDHPVLDLGLIRDRVFRGWLVGAVFLSTGATGVLIFLPAYLQGTSGFSAGDTGLIMLLATVPVFVFPTVGGRLVSRGFPARHLVVGSLLLSAAGNLWLALSLTPDAGPLRLAAPLVLLGVGIGLAMGQIEAQALGAVTPERVGMASGLLSTARGGAGAMVVAVFGSALLTLVESRLGDGALAGRVATGQLGEVGGEFTDAWQLTVGAVAVLLTVAAVLVHRLLRPRTVPVPPKPKPEQEPEQEQEQEQEQGPRSAEQEPVEKMLTG
ncbi:MFS transporter [Streptomyces sp. NPDC020965]|uniref:MFS transporter n=1 Tax=Streptomyces sp. NPDC020965 TaxID=3365105 RepID=UPI0037AEA313